MKGTKTTIYLPDDLRKEVKKHLIDTGETLSKFTELALRRQLEFDNTRAGKKRLRAKQQADELDDMIRDLVKD